MLIKNIFILFCFAASWSPLVCTAQPAQERPASRPRTQPLDEASLTRAIAETKEDYRIGPGDVIGINIDRAPELSGEFRVSASGTIYMDYLGRMTVQNMTQEELSALIADGLRGRYLKNPSVSITIEQINSHTFFIQGAVNRPGAYQLEGKPTLMKLIIVAGGLSVNHGTSAYIIREVKQPMSNPVLHRTAAAPPTGDEPRIESQESKEKEDDMYELIRVSISGLFRGDFDKNMYVEPGSIINIPPADVFFVAGEVHAPGSFPFREGTTLRQAISLAQGTNFKAASGSGLIFREDPVTRRRQEIKVDIASVMNGKKDDIPILANDVIIVPNSRFKSVSGTLLSGLGTSIVRIPRW
jgi:polysaccharide biosynthesis/export protein